MIMFNVSFENIVKYLLPPTHRQTRFLAFLFAPVRALNTVYTAFKEYRNAINDTLRYTSQIAVFVYLLNKNFNNSQPGITITTNSITRVYVFNKSETQTQTFLYNDSEGQTITYLKNKSEYFLEYNFTINIPIALQYTFDENELFGLVNYYKLAGMTYNIEYN